MTKYFLLLAAAPLALAAPAQARDADNAEPAAAQNAPEAKQEVFSTGVAKGRDRDAAIDSLVLRWDLARPTAARLLDLAVEALTAQEK